MHIGILQTGHAPDEIIPAHGDYPEMFARLLAGQGLHFSTWAVVDNDFPEGPEAAEGWLVTGSRHGAYEDHPWIPPLEALIREIHASGRPLVGICFGHQIIAQALGGRVEKFSGGWSVGRTLYEVEGAQMPLNAWHQDQVVAPPPGAEVVGRSDFCPYAALRIGERTFTLQPHPEFDGPVVADLIDYRGRGVVPAPLLERAAAQTDAPVARADIAERIADVFRGAHG